MRSIVSCIICIALIGVACSNNGSKIDAGSKRADRAVTRRPRTPATFDLLTPSVAPGGTFTASVNLPKGWIPTGLPIIVSDGDLPPTFEIVPPTPTIKASKDGTIYSVTVKNTGPVAMRFVADVPCAGCP